MAYLLKVERGKAALGVCRQLTSSHVFKIRKETPWEAEARAGGLGGGTWQQLGDLLTLLREKIPVLFALEQTSQPPPPLSGHEKSLQRNWDFKNEHHYKDGAIFAAKYFL